MKIIASILVGIYLLAFIGAIIYTYYLYVKYIMEHKR